MESRKQNRLPGFDYSAAGAYFVTICVQDRQRLLSKIAVGDGVLDVPKICLSPEGRVVKNRIDEINKVYEHVSIDRYVIMPNHIHMIVRIHSGNGTSRTPSPTNSVLAQLVSTFKRFVHRELGCSIFQRSYYEHVIRNEEDYLQICEYMENNPAKWERDLP